MQHNRHMTTSNILPLEGFHILKDYIALEYKLRNQVLDIFASKDRENLEGLKAYYASFAKITLEVLDEEWQLSLASTSKTLNQRRLSIINTIHDSLHRLQDIQQDVQEGSACFVKEVQFNNSVVNLPIIQAKTNHAATAGLSIRWISRFF